MSKGSRHSFWGAIPQFAVRCRRTAAGHTTDQRETTDGSFTFLHTCWSTPCSESLTLPRMGGAGGTHTPVCPLFQGFDSGEPDSLLISPPPSAACTHGPAVALDQRAALGRLEGLSAHVYRWWEFARHISFPLMLSHRVMPVAPDCFSSDGPL